MKKIPFKEDFEDLASLSSFSKKLRPKIVYVSNPNNPMGTFNNKTKIQTFINEVPDDTIICLDEAYADFVPDDDSYQAAIACGQLFKHIDDITVENFV